jgi:CheY-like chemotaxis protein
MQGWEMTGGVHILVAEDEDLVAMALSEVLEAEGFRVTMTHSGQEAIDADALDPADLLVTDMRMPVLGGKALIKTLRERRPNLPIIVMTGYSEHLPNEEPGRLVVLRKPFSMSALVRKAVVFLRPGILQDV